LLDSRPDIRVKGLEYVIKAFETKPSPAPVLDMVLIAARDAKLRPRIFEACKKFFDEFTQNENKYKEDGCRQKLIAVFNAGSYLERIAENRKDTELAEFYKTKREEYRKKQNELTKTKKW